MEGIKEKALYPKIASVSYAISEVRNQKVGY